MRTIPEIIPPMPPANIRDILRKYDDKPDFPKRYDGTVRDYSMLDHVFDTVTKAVNDLSHMRGLSSYNEIVDYRDSLYPLIAEQALISQQGRKTE